MGSLAPVLRTLGQLGGGGAVVPDPIEIAVDSEGDGAIVVELSGVTAGYRAYLRWRYAMVGFAWSAESLALSRVGSGLVTLPGLTNGLLVEASAYQKDPAGAASAWADPVYGSARGGDAPSAQTQYRVVGIEKVPGTGKKRLLLEKVGKPLVPLA